MNAANEPILVIGSGTLMESVRAAVDPLPVRHFTPALEGVWRAGQERFSAIIVGAHGSKTLPAVRALRAIAPHARILVACAAVEEPVAIQSLNEGADEYILEPIDAEELRARLAASRTKKSSQPSSPTDASPETAKPCPAEVQSLGEILRNLDEGTHAVLNRLAMLVQQAFGSAGVAIELDDLRFQNCEAAEIVVELPIERNGQRVGRVGLARRLSGPFDGAVAGRLAEYAALADVVMAQARDREQWRELAWTDDLSGLRNRRYFDRAFDDLLRRAGDEHLRCTVFLFDIDDFKRYNGLFGHQTGDALIRELATLLRHCTRQADIVARYGGDEFAVVFWDSEKRRLPDSDHPREPLALAERFCKTIAEHEFRCLGDHAPGPVTISGGLASFPWSGTTRQELLDRADAALREAKKQGKNRIHLAGSENPPASTVTTADT